MTTVTAIRESVLGSPEVQSCRAAARRHMDRFNDWFTPEDLRRAELAERHRRAMQECDPIRRMQFAAFQHIESMSAGYILTHSDDRVEYVPRQPSKDMLDLMASLGEQMAAVFLRYGFKRSGDTWEPTC